MYGSWTIKQLRSELNRRNAKVSGHKHELVERYSLINHDILFRCGCDAFQLACTMWVTQITKSVQIADTYCRDPDRKNRPDPARLGYVKIALVIGAVDFDQFSLSLG